MTRRRGDHGRCGRLRPEADKGTDIVGVIRRVAAGESLLDPDATRRVLDRIRNPPEEESAASLTRRAPDSRARHGWPDQPSDRRGDVPGRKTVKNVSNLLAKLGMERRTQAAVFGARTQQRTAE
jgi:hypothetical protein